MQTNLLLFGCFRKGFITHLFCKWLLYTLEAAEHKYTCTVSKHMSKMQCWALFVISKATFMETARPSLLLNPRFRVDWKLLKLSNMVQKWVNIESMSYICLSFCSHWDFLLSQGLPMQHARIYRTWLPSEIYSLLFSPILQHYHISERFQRATKRD